MGEFNSSHCPSELIVFTTILKRGVHRRYIRAMDGGGEAVDLRSRYVQCVFLPFVRHGHVQSDSDRLAQAACSASPSLENNCTTHVSGSGYMSLGCVHNRPHRVLCWPNSSCVVLADLIACCVGI